MRMKEPKARIREKELSQNPSNHSHGIPQNHDWEFDDFLVKQQL